jgi:hypothetical protein
MIPALGYLLSRIHNPGEAFKMNKSLALMGFLLISCLFQGSANSKEELKVVHAGDFATFNVQLAETPQFSGGHVAVLVGPININFPDDIIVSQTQYTRTTSTDTIANQNVYKMSVRIPGDAPSGVWEAFFSFAVPNGSYSPLHHARQIFKVQRQEYSGVPVNATIGLE